MSLRSGFEASIKIDNKEVKTITDITYPSAFTPIRVANRASTDVRYINGMKDNDLTFTVQAGTDPEDTEGEDMFAYLKGKHDNGQAVNVVFTDASGTASTGKAYIVNSFEIGDLVDDLETANVTLKRSAISVVSGS